MPDCNCHSHNGFQLSRSEEGLEQRRGDSFEFDGVDKRQLSLYLDKVGSVSGSPVPEFIFNDSVLEDQYRRFLNGS